MQIINEIESNIYKDMIIKMKYITRDITDEAGAVEALEQINNLYKTQYQKSLYNTELYKLNEIKKVLNRFKFNDTLRVNESDVYLIKDWLKDL